MQSKRDENRITTLLGALNSDGITPNLVAINSSNYGLKVDNSGATYDPTVLAYFPYRIPITINHTKVGDDLTNYPLYIDLSLFGDDFWNYVKNGGGDIRITTSDGTTECAREVVSCDTSAKTGEVHTLIPAVSSSVDTIFYIYYGNQLVSDYAPTDTYGRNAVWGTNAKYVGHFQNDANDSSANSANGTVAGVSLVSSKLGKSYLFDGINANGIILPGALLNDFANGYAISFWLKNYKSNRLTDGSYQAESISGASTGIVSGSYRKGRQGIDTNGGTLINYVVSNTNFGSISIPIYGYQTNASVFAGTYKISDNVTNEVFLTGNLIKVVSTDSDKRMNNHIFNAKGHDILVQVFFADTTDLYIDYFTCIRSGYDDYINKASVFEHNGNGGVRTYFNGTSIGTYNDLSITNVYEKINVVYNKTDIRIYVNSILMSTYAQTATPNSNTSNVGLGYNGGGTKLWGEMDEFRINKDPATFSQSLITTEYNNQSSAHTFYTFNNYEILQNVQNAVRDENRVPVAMAVSSVDGVTPVELYSDNLYNLLIQST